MLTITRLPNADGFGNQEVLLPVANKKTCTAEANIAIAAINQKSNRINWSRACALSFCFLVHAIAANAMSPITIS